MKMKIEKRSNANLVPFKNVPAGVVFKGVEGAICITLDRGYINSAPYYNAVNVINGKLWAYDDDEMVEILEDATLIY
jgi:hypothetical protein